MADKAKINVDLSADSSNWVAGMTQAEKAMADFQQQTERFVGRFNAGFDGVTKSAKASANAIEAALDRQRRSMQHLIDAADPAAAALRHVGDVEQRVNAALAAGTITASEHALIMSNISRVAGTAGRGYANLGILVQQAGFQIADVAAVAANGGNAMATAGTQLGQFLGFMGPIGAVVGAGVTILGLFATKMMDSSNATDEAKHAADLYEKCLNDLVNIEKEYNDTLRERQGLPKADENINRLKQRAIEAHYAVEDAPSQSLWGGMWSRFKEASGFGRTKTDAEVARAQDMSASGDYSYASDLSLATKEEKLKIATQQLNEERQRETDLMRVNAEERERAKAMMDAEQRVREKLKDTIANPEEVNAEVQNARAAAAATYDQTKAEEKNKKAQEETLQVVEKMRKEVEKYIEEKQKLSASLDTEIADNDRLIAALKVSEDEYRRVNAQIEVERKFRSANVEMSQEDQQRAQRISAQNVELDEQKKHMESLNKLGSDLGMTFSSAFEDAIVEGKKFSEILQSLYQDMLRLIIRNQITQPLASSSGSVFSGIFDSIKSLVGFKSGTDHAPAGLAWVGENGPELVNFGGGELVYPSRLSKQIAAMSAVPGFAEGAYSNLPMSDFSNVGTQVNIINNAGADIRTEKKTVGGVDTIEVMVDRITSKQLSRRGSALNGTIRKTFGAQERLISR